MKQKYYIAMIPALVLGVAFGLASTASAHGFGFGQNLSSDEIASRQQVMFESRAKLIGATTDEVKSAWASGKSLKDLASEKGVTEAMLKERMQAERKAQMKTHLNALVAKGVITQAQADQRLQTIEKHQAERVQKDGAGKEGRGPRGGFGLGM